METRNRFATHGCPPFSETAGGADTLRLMPLLQQQEFGPAPSGRLFPEQVRLTNEAQDRCERVELRQRAGSTALVDSDQREYLVIPLPEQTRVPTKADCGSGR